MTQDIHDLVIAGSGIAGLSAAVYAARADLDPLVLEGDEPGGQLTLTTDVENYLGFPDGVGGMDLVQRGKEQAEQFGAEFEHGRIEDADLDGQPLELSLSTGDTIYTLSLIVATGASARWVGAENEDDLMGHGLSTCATCDGAFHRGDDVLVVGGGDSAMEEALFLAKFADSVTVVHRREELRASEIMADRARENDDVQFRWNTELEAIHGSQEKGVTGATLVSHPEGSQREGRVRCRRRARDGRRRRRVLRRRPHAEHAVPRRHRRRTGRGRLHLHADRRRWAAHSPDGRRWCVRCWRRR